MNEIVRKKSPRAPTLPLEEALDKAFRAYDRERLHPAPTEVVAQNIGYKGANNGAALSALASLRYFGLLERPKDGFLAVAKDVESFKFAPNEAKKRELLMGFLKRPPLYAELIDKYQGAAPSDANLKYELIQRGFAPQAADSAVSCFKKSVIFAGYEGEEDQPEPSEQEQAASDEVAYPDARAMSRSPNVTASEEDSSQDRIPIRLPGGRRAWLVIPTPFFEADKARIKAQIDLLLTQEDEA